MMATPSKWAFEGDPIVTPTEYRFCTKLRRSARSTPSNHSSFHPNPDGTTQDPYIDGYTDQSCQYFESTDNSVKTTNDNSVQTTNHIHDNRTYHQTNIIYQTKGVHESRGKKGAKASQKGRFPPPTSPPGSGFLVYYDEQEFDAESRGYQGYQEYVPGSVQGASSMGVPSGTLETGAVPSGSLPEVIGSLPWDGQSVDMRSSNPIDETHLQPLPGLAPYSSQTSGHIANYPVALEQPTIQPPFGYEYSGYGEPDRGKDKRIEAPANTSRIDYPERKLLPDSRSSHNDNTLAKIDNNEIQKSLREAQGSGKHQGHERRHRQKAIEAPRQPRLIGPPSSKDEESGSLPEPPPRRNTLPPQQSNQTSDQPNALVRATTDLAIRSKEAQGRDIDGGNPPDGDESRPNNHDNDQTKPGGHRRESRGSFTAHDQDNAQSGGSSDPKRSSHKSSGKSGHDGRSQRHGHSSHGGSSHGLSKKERDIMWLKWGTVGAVDVERKRRKSKK
ncbi:hypothetical protein F4778DRAFT_297852 [Xylariomycetidae sp. FL2044]|nr:hypothetical protein F4778DRAFT_297852 [Xylariomycetidae sp. FL2044]